MRLLVLTSLALLAAPALAQQPDVGAEPLYGTVTLRAGFQPDPHTTEVIAGGMSRNPISGAGCVGYLNLNRPDLDLNYTAGTLPLRISASSSTDTGLLVNLPDGSWICDDDGGEGTDPLVHLQSPQSGNYNIWVTTYHENAQTEATVSISEHGAGGTGGSAAAPDVWAAPLYGTLDLAAGFQPDPQVRNIDAGGNDANPVSGAGCAGYINAERPDLDINYTPGHYPLVIYVRSNSDTTLLVNLPDGSWVCSDDASGHDPMIRLDRPAAGNYNVWVGTYGAGATQKAGLYVSEAEPN